jgi:hypothetical protein
MVVIFKNMSNEVSCGSHEKSTAIADDLTVLTRVHFVTEDKYTALKIAQNKQGLNPVARYQQTPKRCSRLIGFRWREKLR